MILLVASYEQSGEEQHHGRQERCRCRFLVSAVVQLLRLHRGRTQAQSTIFCSPPRPSRRRWDFPLLFGSRRSEVEGVRLPRNGLVDEVEVTTETLWRSRAWKRGRLVIHFHTFKECMIAEDLLTNRSIPDFLIAHEFRYVAPLLGVGCFFLD